MCLCPLVIVQYCFPPQSQVIAACAELSRRLLTRESTGDKDAKQDGKVNGWFTKVDKPKLKEDEKQSGKTLVVVGYAHKLIVSSGIN